MKKLALLLSLILTTASAPAQILGVNFNTDTDRQGALMLSTDTAGVFGEVISNWNNVAFGGDGTPGYIDNGSTVSWTADGLANSTGVSTSVGLVATSDYTGDGPAALWGTGTDLTSGDTKLFSGGLQIRAHTASISFSALSSFAPNGYSVYAYFTDVSGTPVTVTANGSSLSLNTSGFSGTYANGSTSGTGNYLLFSG